MAKTTKTNHTTRIMIHLKLKTYCADPDIGRFNIEAPWRVKEFVYATDGRILVRVPAADYPDVADNPQAPSRPSEDKESYPWNHSTLDSSFWKYPTSDMRACYHPPCHECAGTGDHECQHCKNLHECGKCNGSGISGIITGIDIGLVRLSSFYCYKLCQLPDVELWIDPKNNSVDPIPFRFKGGCGYLMPMRK